MKKIVIAWIICVLGLAILFAWVGPSMMAQRDGQTSQNNDLITADFTLQSGDKVVTAESLRGKYLLIYFGFTHCPDICPTTLLLMNNAINGLGAKAEKVLPVFITIDPERDTPKAAADYAKHFGKNTLGLSGTPEQIKQAADNFKVYYSKVEDKGSALGYVMDHSGFIYLIGPDGKYLAHYTHTSSEQEIKQGLMQYVK